MAADPEEILEAAEYLCGRRTRPNTSGDKRRCLELVISGVRDDEDVRGFIYDMIPELDPKRFVPGSAVNEEIAQLRQKLWTPEKQKSNERLQYPTLPRYMPRKHEGTWFVQIARILDLSQAEYEAACAVGKVWAKIDYWIAARKDEISGSSSNDIEWVQPPQDNGKTHDPRALPTPRGPTPEDREVFEGLRIISIGDVKYSIKHYEDEKNKADPWPRDDLRLDLLEKLKDYRDKLIERTLKIVGRNHGTVY